MYEERSVLRLRFFVKFAAIAQRGELLQAMQALSQLSYGPAPQEKAQPDNAALIVQPGVPTGIRTPVATVKG